jgi:hypothetical protein
MEMEKRLIKLAADVAVERETVFIKAWPERIKREAVYLSGVFSIEKVSNATKFPKGMLQSWIRKWSPEEEVCQYEFAEENIKITRIVANPIESFVQEIAPIASIVKAKIEFKIYCKDMAERIVEKFFI